MSKAAPTSSALPGMRLGTDPADSAGPAFGAARDALYQELVLEHKRAPRRFGHLDQATHRARGHNPQCGDDLTVEVRRGDGRLQDLRFHGQGCAICIASASMMGEAVSGGSESAARELHERFRAVLRGEIEPEQAQLGKLSALAGVNRYPSRIKCALLGWHALMHTLDEAAAVADLGPARPEERP